MLLVFVSASLQFAYCFIIVSKAHYLYTLQVVIKPKSVDNTIFAQTETALYNSGSLKLLKKW